MPVDWGNNEFKQQIHIRMLGLAYALCLPLVGKGSLIIHTAIKNMLFWEQEYLSHNFAIDEEELCFFNLLNLPAGTIT